MGFRVQRVHLWRAQWDGLCRLARSLGLRVRKGPEGDRRGALVEAVVEALEADELNGMLRHPWLVA